MIKKINNYFENVFQVLDYTSLKLLHTQNTNCALIVWNGSEEIMLTSSKIHEWPDFFAAFSNLSKVKYFSIQISEYLDIFFFFSF